MECHYFSSRPAWGSEESSWFLQKDATGTLALGRVLHDLIIRGGLETDLTIGTTLVNMYGNHGSLEEAGFVLNSMENPNEVTWGLMVTACVQHNYFHAAAGLIVKMLRKEMNLDKTSVMGVLRGCSKSGTIVYGRLLHSQLIESGLTMDNEVKSALIDMYAKCGSPRDSCKASEGFAPGNNVVLWDAKIASFAYSGCFESVQHCLRTMERQRVKPDRVIFVGLLSACSSVGVLEEGCQYFTSMRSDYGIEPGIDEYNSMIELLGRVGLAEEAEAFLLSMPLSPDFVGWMSLLSSCTDSYRVGLGRSSFEQIVKADPYDASGYVLMASIYAGAHMWQDMMAVNHQER